MEENIGAFEEKKRKKGGKRGALAISRAKKGRGKNACFLPKKKMLYLRKVRKRLQTARQTKSHRAR